MYTDKSFKKITALFHEKRIVNLDFMVKKNDSSAFLCDDSFMVRGAMEIKLSICV